MNVCLMRYIDIFIMGYGVVACCVCQLILKKDGDDNDDDDDDDVYVMSVIFSECHGSG